MLYYKPRKVICPICGKKFTTMSRVQKYCSVECYNQSQIDSRKAKKQYLKNKRKLV